MRGDKMSITEERLAVKKKIQLGKDLNKAKIKVLHDNGYSNAEIGRVMGLSEATIRTILKSQEKESE
jgi:DNA-binding NarL/FixJ family response regulator